MSEKTKTIQINPELFSLSSSNTTRKQSRKTPKQPSSGPIKVKNPSSKPKNTSTLKRNLLKMFRNHYDDKYKQQDKRIQQQIREEKKQPSQANNPNPNPTPNSNSDFESSLNYLQQLSEKKPSPSPVVTTPTIVQTFTKPQPPRPIQNHTIKNNNGMENIPVHTNLPPSFNIDSLPKPSTQHTMILKPPSHAVPQYGCLKNGSLPTYRTWKHNTQRNNPRIPNIPKPSNDSIVQGSVPSQKFSEHMEEQLKQMSLRDQRREKRQETQPFQAKRQKQKRILRRTFHVGKSKQHPHISVLVSNRTIRNNTNLHLSKLKNTPVHEVKKYLLKHGFIKVGSTTPTDVLRQMYESASLICGEVKNRNPDNLLYNYFNQEPEDSFSY